MSGDMLKGKVAVVTGSGRGIGRAMAIMMASQGASVVVNDLGASLDGSNTEGTPAQEVVDTIRKAGGKAVVSSESVVGWENGKRIVQTALDAFGRIDIVVNNAGILRDGMFHKMTPENFDAVIKVHLYGMFYVSRAAVDHFRKQESGCYIHFTSTSGIFGNVGQANYGAAKMAMLGFNQSLALELARFNIRSNCIAPGAWTRMTDSVPGRSVEEKQKRAAVMPPESPATLATVLASDAAKNVSGQVLGARGNEIILYSQTRPIRFLNKKSGWTPETLAEALPKFSPLFIEVASGKTISPWTPD